MNTLCVITGNTPLTVFLPMKTSEARNITTLWTHTLEIKRAFGLLDCLAFDRMGIDHGCSYITVAQQFLNCPDIVIGLQEMTGEAVTKCVGRSTLNEFRLGNCPFYGLLDMSCVKMVAPVFLFCFKKSQGLCREKPLPGQFRGSVLIFFFK